MGSGKLYVCGIIVGVEILGFVRFVIEHIRFGGAGSVEVVHTELGVVFRAISTIAGRHAVILPFKEFCKNCFIRLDGRFIYPFAHLSGLITNGRSF